MRSACFHVTITGNFESFQYFNFWKTFWKTQNLPLLVESTKIENKAFLYKTALSKANLTTNEMESTKLIYHKEFSFASNYFIFSKILLQFKNFNVLSTIQMSIFMLFENIGVLFEDTFSLGVSLTVYILWYIAECRAYIFYAIT